MYALQSGINITSQEMKLRKNSRPPECNNLAQPSLKLRMEKGLSSPKKLCYSLCIRRDKQAVADLFDKEIIHLLKKYFYVNHLANTSSL